MTLDEAIEHCYEAAASASCKECSDKHLQLAEWLCQLREVKKIIEGL